ncbi:MAG: aldo/keto reductase [Deltaproteobacteria bacterium]|nr:aldo/keto reductase [Deltaproteobacteria bacterium]
MEYRQFGTTGLQVSELVFGGGAVGGLLINQDNDTKRAAVRRAMEAGINWFDTAPSYGQGRSEEALGWLLKEVDNAPYLSTKVTIDTRDLNDIPGQIERSLTASLERLKLHSVTSFYLHNRIGPVTGGYTISTFDILRKDGVLDGLERVKDQGLVRCFGITALGDAPSIIGVIKSGRIASAQVYYNLLNPSAGFSLPKAWGAYDFSGILDACKKYGVAAMGIRILSAGVIATDERTGREQPITPGDTVESETIKAQKIFAAIGTDYGTRAQTAIRFALAQKKLSCAIFGLAELAHLEEAIAAQTKGPIPQEGLERLKAVYNTPLSQRSS